MRESRPESGRGVQVKPLKMFPLRPKRATPVSTEGASDARPASSSVSSASRREGVGWVMCRGRDNTLNRKPQTLTCLPLPAMHARPRVDQTPAARLVHRYLEPAENLSRHSKFDWSSSLYGQLIKAQRIWLGFLIKRNKPGRAWTSPPRSRLARAPLSEICVRCVSGRGMGV